MTAYYNEIDPYAAQWLRNLIEAGHIAPGDVDQRPIQEVKPDDLKHYTQCHFFAGIGVWSHALRRAGWSDDQPIWTGSCPCQPFSQAGKQKGFADERHLWPWWKNLIEICKPPVIVGEQVASALDWLDLVQTEMEISGYAFGAADLCAAGFGGAHIRQRLYFVGLGNAERGGSQGHAGDGGATGREGPKRPVTEASVSGGMDDSQRVGWGERWDGNYGSNDRQQFDAASGDGRPNALMLGRNPVDWLYCRDGKWRPVEPGTFPLAHAAPARVGRLRAYGNALDAETATEFLRAVKGCAP